MSELTVTATKCFIVWVPVNMPASVGDAMGLKCKTRKYDGVIVETSCCYTIFAVRLFIIFLLPKSH